MKKILNYLLVIALVLIQFIPAVNAATITVDKAVKGQTYKAYKIFDVTKSGDNYAYSINYKNDGVENPWFAIVNAYATSHPEELTLTNVKGTNKYVVAVSEKFKAAEFAKHLNDNKGTIDADGSATADGTLVDINVTEAGYYFVDSSLGALCALHTAADEITVEEKNAEPTVEKTASQETAGIGETVTFTINVTAGGSADTSYIVRDTMTDGLDLVADSISIEVNETAVANTNYTISTSAHGFEINFLQSYTASLDKDTVIVITYEAVVNENAIVNSNVINNVELVYGNSSTTDRVVIPNYDFELVKTDESQKELTGAKFKLYTADGVEIPVVLVREGTYRVAKANEEGVLIEAGRVMIQGLSSGDYALEEVEAPEGYNQLVERHQFSIEDADLVETAAVTVVNTTGKLLPSTGGMGTVLFLTIGSIMVIGFGVLLVTKLRLAKMSI